MPEFFTLELFLYLWILQVLPEEHRNNLKLRMTGYDTEKNLRGLNVQQIQLNHERQERVKEQRERNGARCSTHIT